MARRHTMMGLSVISLFLGLFFLMNNHMAVTGSFLGIAAGSTVGALSGLVFLVLSGVFYFLRGEEETEI